MLIVASFVASQTINVVKLDALDESAKKELIQWLMAWFGVLLGGGLAALYACLFSNVHAARICSFAFIFSIALAAFLGVYFQVHSTQMYITHFISASVNVVLCLFVELYISVQIEMDATVLVTKNHNVMYTPLLDGENEPTAPMLIL